MAENPNKESEPHKISSDYAAVQERFKGFAVRAESTRYRMYTQLIATTLALVAGIGTSLVSVRDLFGQVPRLSSSILITTSIAFGVGILIALATFTIKRFADRRGHADRVREAIEAAYFGALDRSSLNPRLSYSHNAERTY